MKIGMQTWGTEGDIRPFIALAGELQKAGHEVILAATCFNKMDFASFEKNLGFRLIDHAMPAYESDFMARLGKTLVDERNFLKQLRMVLSYFLDPVTDGLLVDAKKLCRENEILIRHAIVYPAAIAAEKANLPCVSVFPTLAPVPSKVISPLNKNLGGYVNSLMWKLVDRYLNRCFRSSIDAMRKRENLLPVDSVLQNSWFSDWLTLFTVSPALFPPQTDWKDNFHVCGFCNVPEENESVPIPDGLEKFLDSGSRPIFMTFGSVMEMDPSPGGITRLMVDAAGIAGCRAIIQSRWDLIDDIPENPDIYRVAEVAH
ncbi:MAG: glycosyltransferase [Acidobacteria bacterium]|nr:glycosyltransferase [Acidobacteriota bacterium]